MDHNKTESRIKVKLGLMLMILSRSHVFSEQETERCPAILNRISQCAHGNLLEHARLCSLNHKTEGRAATVVDLFRALRSLQKSAEVKF
jgi:hypothetical protein